MARYAGTVPATGFWQEQETRPNEATVEEPTFYLFAKPSWKSGAARVLDLFGTFDDFNFSEDPAQADAIAIYLDFRAFGLDLMSASGNVMSAHEQEKA